MLDDPSNEKFQHSDMRSGEMERGRLSVNREASVRAAWEGGSGTVFDFWGVAASSRANRWIRGI
jgi:hypothetical protein